MQTTKFDFYKNTVICCPQCGNETLEETGLGWYICCDKDCDWGDKL